MNWQSKNKHARKYPDERRNMKAKENKQKSCRIRQRLRTMSLLLIPHRGASPYEYAVRLIQFVGEAEKKHREPSVCSVAMCRPPNSWSTRIRCVVSKFIKSLYQAFNKCYVEIHALILTVELLVLLLRIREVTGSNLGFKTMFNEIYRRLLQFVQANVWHRMRNEYTIEIIWPKRPTP